MQCILNNTNEYYRSIPLLGEPFEVCFANANEGKKCLCSTELCNNSIRIDVAKNILLSMLSLTIVFL